MFKNMKLATKMAVGFGLLVIICIILGSIGVLGLKNVSASVDLRDLGDEALTTVYKGGGARKEFELHGFETIGANNQTAADVWLANTEEMEEAVRVLSRANGLSADDRQSLASIVKDVSSYKGLINQYFEVRHSKEDAFAGWLQTGNKISTEITGALDLIIAPQLVAAKKIQDVTSVAKWADIQNGLHANVIEPFFLLRVKATYLTK